MVIYALFFCIVDPKMPIYNSCSNEGTFYSLTACNQAKPHNVGAVLTDQAKRDGAYQRFVCMKKETPDWEPAE